MFGTQHEQLNKKLLNHYVIFKKRNIITSLRHEQLNKKLLNHYVMF